MYCNKCGKEVKETENFCSSCGNKLRNIEYSKEHAYNNGYQPMQRTNGYQTNVTVDNSKDIPTAGLFILSFLIPVAGLVLYCVWSGEAPKKAKYCLKGFIASIVFYTVLFCCVMSVAFSRAEKTKYYYQDDFYSHVVEVID